MTNSDISKLLLFLEKSENLKSTLRHNWTKSGRQESSAEHTWRSSLLLILLIDKLNIKIDLEKALKMMIIHDLPESIYGDIPGFAKLIDKNKHKLHKKREKIAAAKLFSSLPEPLNNEMLALFNELEQGKSKEAKIVDALEKIETMIQHLNSGTDYWTEVEKGNHMLNYPQKALNSLNNSHLNNFWEKILSQIRKALA